jgi:hypothetical protein
MVGRAGRCLGTPCHLNGPSLLSSPLRKGSLESGDLCLAGRLMTKPTIKFFRFRPRLRYVGTSTERLEIMLSDYVSRVNIFFMFFTKHF